MDGKCDPAGRFWFGSLVEDNSGAQRQPVPDWIQTSLSPAWWRGVGNSNGLAWSLDHKTMYYIDTPTRQVFAFDYDKSSGDISNRRGIIRVPDSMGWPDGMTIDDQGKLWVALFQGAGVSRWDPDTGGLLELYPIPAPNITSCAFGGTDLNHLYVTSAQFLMNSAGLKAYPQSGALFRLELPFRGVPCFEFK